MASQDSIKFEVIKKIAETKFKFKDLKRVQQLDSNSPPSVFIGSKLRYPDVNVGILSPLQRDDDAWLYDDEKYWAAQNFEIRDVIELRNSLLNSRFRGKVKDARYNSKFVDIAKDIAIASKPVDVEIELKRGLRVREKDRIMKPVGMRASLEKAKITSNVKVARAVDKVVSDDDLKSTIALEYLYNKGFDEYTLNKILSVGVLGLKKNRRFVPTRWSITATDDTIGKQMLRRVRDYKWIDDFELFVGGFMGNYYLIFLFPGVWSYELFELYLPGSSWNPSCEIKAATDMEYFEGRKNYATSTSGGYYASRLPIIKYLDRIKRQATVLAVRLETPTYWAALGVWVVRESVKKTMNKKGMKFDSREELIEGGKQIGKVKFKFDASEILGKSVLLNQVRTQKRISEWF
jgi:DNA repair protein NreA